jgi:uncharacterized protein (DUF1778 family)
MIKSDKKKKQNPYTKRNLIQARVDTEEFREILTKAELYTKGNVSDFVRMAALNYRNPRKVTK